MLRRLRPAALALAVVASALTALVLPARVDASSTLLCKGFTDCANRGYSNFGYAAVYRQMFWRMYGGHNCTNYVAYRMIRNGMSATRPWSGSGDARNWGIVFAKLTNQTPTVGSVAWWSGNHVAYVQKVVDANTIIISEDHWGGDFDWRRIVRSGGGWPTGFIHLKDEGLSATVAPRIVGTPRVGSVLSATAGTWTQAATYAFQWLAGGVAIPGATSNVFTPTPAQIGKAVTVRVTATRAGTAPVASTSAATTPVGYGTFTVTAPPEVDGYPRVGEPLTATPPALSPSPGATAYAWLADGTAIKDATTDTLVPGPAEVGKTITVSVNGMLPGFAIARTTTPATTRVAPGFLRLGAAPRLTGEARVGKTLGLVLPTWSPGATSTSVVWKADGVAIPGQTGPTLTLAQAQLGRHITATVTGRTAAYYPATATSAATTAVAPAPIRATGSPVISGSLMPSRTLTVTLPTTTPAATAHVQWLRSGRPIAGATGRTYTIREGDLGTTLGVRVTWSRTGYESLSRTVNARAQVSTLAYIYTGRPHASGIRIAVRAVGVSVADGWVTIAAPSGRRVTHALRNGVTTFSPSWLRPGSRQLTISFWHSARIPNRVVKGTFRVY